MYKYVIFSQNIEADSRGLLGNTLGRVNLMLGGGKTNRQIMCYVVMFIVFMFIVLYYLISRLSSS